MWIRRYRAPDMPSALKRIRADLGPEAIILESRQVRTGGLTRFLRPPVVEVLVATETRQRGSRDSASPKKAAHGVAGLGHTPNPVRPGAPDPLSLSESPRPPSEPSDGCASAASPDALDWLARELSSLRASLRRLEQNSRGRGDGDPNPRFAPVRDWLSQQQVDGCFGAELCAAIQERVGATASPDDIQKALLASLEERLPTTGPLELSASYPTVLCLVGPTGVGKTTTLAKLAALAVKGGEQVAMVTIDTFRVAAAAQIGTYAEIMGVPLHVAYSPEELRGQIHCHRDKGLVLVDTPGCSHLNGGQLDELHTFLEAVPGCAIHVTVAASTDYREQLQVVDAFRVVHPSAMVLTKLDETTRYGPALSLIRCAGLPVSYVTYGQRVPEDLAVATTAELAGLLIQGRCSSRGGPPYSMVEGKIPVSGHPGRQASQGCSGRAGAWQFAAYHQRAAI